MNRERESESEPASGETTPGTPGAGTQEGSENARRVMRDDIKEQHTSHWDMDVMPRAEMEALYLEQKRRKRRRRLAMVAGVFGGLVAVGCAAALLLT